MGRRFDEMLLAELLIERTIPMVQQAQAMKTAGQKGHNLGQWERLLRDLTQTDPSQLFEGYKDDDIFKQIAGIQDYRRSTVIGGSGKSKLTQTQMDRHRQIFGFDTHHLFGLDENQMLTMLMTKPADMAGISAVRRANDRQAYFDTGNLLGRKSGSEQFASEPIATHKGNAVEGSNIKNPSLSQAASYHEGQPKVLEPYRYEVGMGDPEALMMEFYHTQERQAARNAELMDPTNPTHGNRLRELRVQTIKEADKLGVKPGQVSRMWEKGEFDKLEELFPDKGIKALYEEAQGITRNPNDRLLQPGEVVDPRAAQAELAGRLPNGRPMKPGHINAAKLLGYSALLPAAAMLPLQAKASEQADERARQDPSLLNQARAFTEKVSLEADKVDAVMPNPIAGGVSNAASVASMVLETPEAIQRNQANLKAKREGTYQPVQPPQPSDRFGYRVNDFLKDPIGSTNQGLRNAWTLLKGMVPDEEDQQPSALNMMSGTSSQ
jgi:hypothetical protein